MSKFKIEILREKVIFVSTGLDYEVAKNVLSVSPSAGVVVDEKGNEVYRLSVTDKKDAGRFDNNGLTIAKDDEICIVKEKPYTVAKAEAEYAKGIIGARLVIAQIEAAAKKINTDLKGAVVAAND